MSGILPATLEPGLTIGHYHIIKRLGGGGMGQVFQAQDTTLKRPVAIKVLSPEFIAHPERLQRFRREAENLAALNHPNIVTVYAVEEIDGHHLLIMELVDGKTLGRLIPPLGFSVENFLPIAVELTDALSAAHERGVTHRDLKPENVMVTHSGRVKVLDFGLAKRAASAVVETSGPGESGLTLAGHVLGTIPYMSPEQAEGRPVDHRSDIFSLGVMFYEMLSGTRPFRGDNEIRLLAAILRDTPRSLSDLRSGLPSPLTLVVHRCLAKDPSRRFESARDLHDELRKIAQPVESKNLFVGSQSAPFGGVRPTPLMRIFATRSGITFLLASIFALNWIETVLEGVWKSPGGAGASLGYDLARAFSWIEGDFSFERHDLTNALAVYAGSFAYFFLPGLLLIATIAALSRRPAIEAYRVLGLAVAITYAISLGFFLFLPVPERWAFSDSEAILLSDLWSPRLIETIRPISGLDNCFPSFHVAVTINMVLVGYLFQLRLRRTLALLGAAVILSTFLLGIHWLADIAAGVALGVLSIRLALLASARLPGHGRQAPASLGPPRNLTPSG